MSKRVKKKSDTAKKKKKKRADVLHVPFLVLIRFNKKQTF